MNILGGDQEQHIMTFNDIFLLMISSVEYERPTERDSKLTKLNIKFVP